MTPNNPKIRSPRSAGFTLPAVLVVVSALLIMVIGLLATSGIERKTARSYVDLQRADMAAHAGLEQVKAILDREASNDDFLIVADVPEIPKDGDKKLEAAPYLYLARGEVSGDSIRYNYHPLFSTATSPDAGSASLHPPDATTLYGDEPQKIEALPWSNPALTAWIPIKATKNGKEQTVARYAFWVEDLQGKINPKVAGNELGDENTPLRSKYPFPAPGMQDPEDHNDDEEVSALSGLALYALDEDATDTPKSGASTKRILDGREWMLSPDSILGATGFAPPLERGDDGLLSDSMAASFEKNFSPAIHSYDERPVIPYSPGISADMAGKPKLNLNKLLSESRPQAIGDFASQIDKALPQFANNLSGRPGGFPEDYLKTLAAGAFDYADSDQTPTIEKGVYRGIDGYPYLSEIMLRVEYKNREAKDGRLLLTLEFKLFAEFWNLTNKPVSGQARLSYEVAMNPEGINSNPGGEAFDQIMTEPTTIHNFQLIGDKYFSAPKSVDLAPDQYKVFEFGTATYTIDVGPNNIDYKTIFYMVEKEKDARGITLKWNDVDVETIPAIVRERNGGSFRILDVSPSLQSVLGKAAIPGHSYGPYNDFYNNMGDPRIAPYVTGKRLGENAYPKNISPNRRNIRRDIYRKGSGNFYGRVLPSEWADGGHDSKYGIFPQLADTDLRLPTDSRFENKLALVEGNAPQRISDAGRFYSATELGNVYDPIMWTFVYDDLKGKAGSGNADTKKLADGEMPSSRHVFPDVTDGSVSSTIYGGGNTLRIGRYEHKRFDKPGLRAAYLLDLFHVGKSTSTNSSDREGNLVTIDGQININTASKDAIRAMAAGVLGQDPELRRVTSWTHDLNSGGMAPSSTKIDLGTPTTHKVADIIADAVVLNRPYSDMAELSAIKTVNDDPVFGNRDLYNSVTNINWSDSAAEELFARIHDSSTFRSRNFRIWVIGQSVTGSESNLEVIAETRKVYTVFADPGERDEEGQIKSQNNKSKVIYENNF